MRIHWFGILVLYALIIFHGYKGRYYTTNLVISEE